MLMISSAMMESLNKSESCVHKVCNLCKLAEIKMISLAVAGSLNQSKSFVYNACNMHNTYNIRATDQPGRGGATPAL